MLAIATPELRTTLSAFKSAMADESRKKNDGLTV
jgi:hypothetical protein